MRASVAVCACVATLANAQHEQTKALSFAAPFNEINQFSGLRHIGGWEVGGSAEVHRSFVRLTAEKQGQKGWMVAHNPLQLKEWSAMLEIRASGTSPHLYGDGTLRAAQRVRGADTESPRAVRAPSRRPNASRVHRPCYLARHKP